MKLEEIMEKQTEGKGYGSLSLDNDSSKQIKKVLKELGINDIIDDLHITVIYDVSNPNIDLDIDESEEYEASISDIKMLGEPGTKWYAIALTLESPDIVNVHKKYIDAGFKHSYPNFIPHLSLKYKPSEENIETIKDNFDKFKDITLVFSNEHLEKINE